MLAVDETSCRRGHNYLTFAADAAAHKVVFVTEGRDAGTICAFSQFLLGHKGTPEQIACVSIDMSPAFIKGVTKYLPNARITFDKFHIVAHASKAVDETRRSEQKTDPSLKGLRWALLKDRQRLGESQRADLDAFVAQATTKRTARAWLYREQLREILDRKQINVVSAMLKRWCANVRRSKVEAMKKVAQMILDHFEGVAAWARPANQRFSRSHQRLVPSREAQGKGISPLPNHANRYLPCGRKPPLLSHQFARHGLIEYFNLPTQNSKEPKFMTAPSRGYLARAFSPISNRRLSQLSRRSSCPTIRRF